MAQDDIHIRVRLLEAARARKDALSVAGGLRSIGMEARSSERAATRMGHAVDTSGRLAGRGLAALAATAKYGAAGIAGLGLAGAKWGLQFNAQVESARLRFKLFTDDVDGLERAVKNIDTKSAFGFGDLTDAAAMLGNSGVKDVADVLQGATNAAAAGGKGAQGLQSIVIALSQIQAKGKLSQEEINQLNEAGAPGAQKAIQDGFNLTSKELSNLGAEGLDATKSLKILTDYWTSGRIKKAAEDQTKTLGGQWQLLTGNMQKMSGAAMEGTAGELSSAILPAANRAAEAITAIFGKDGLSNEQKMRQARQVIVRELGPVWDDLLNELDEADIPGHLGEVIGAAAPHVISAGGQLGVGAVKAFVDAWMSADPLAKILSGLYIGNKLRKGLGGAGFAGGAGKGGIGGLIGKARPVPVIVMNKGFGPDGPDAPGDGPNRKPKSKIQKALEAAKDVARKGGPILAAGAVTVKGNDLVQGEMSGNVGNQGDGTPLGSLFSGPLSGDKLDAIGRLFSGGQVNPSGHLSGTIQPIIVENRTDTHVHLNEKEVARSVTRTQNKTAARRSGGKLTSRGPQGLPG